MHPYVFVHRQLEERGLARGTIGVELDNYYFSAKCYTTLVRELGKGSGGSGGAAIVDSTGLVNAQRIVKSPAEIELMRRTLGEGVEVERIEHLLQAGRRCVYRIRPLT